MTTILVLAVPFSAIFVAISGQANGQGWVLGYVLSVIVLRLGQAQDLNLKATRVHIQFGASLRYVLHLTWDIFLSSWDVAKAVMRRDIAAHIDPGELTVSTQDGDNNQIVTAMSAHGITITPGQLVTDITTEANERGETVTVLHVHNLHRANAEPTIHDEQRARLTMIRRILGYDNN